MADRRSILEEAARLADFYAVELEQLAVDATPTMRLANGFSARMITPQVHEHRARAETARAIAREIRDLIDHPKPHVTERPLIVAG
jgi:hypothetical protein